MSARPGAAWPAAALLPLPLQPGSGSMSRSAWPLSPLPPQAAQHEPSAEHWMCAVVLHRISASKYAALARTLLLLLLEPGWAAAWGSSASCPAAPRAASSMLQGAPPSSSLNGSLHRLLAGLSALSKPAAALTTAAGELPRGEPVQSSCASEVQLLAAERAGAGAGSSSLRCRFHPNIPPAWLSEFA